MATTDYQQLAREFLNLWQKQMATVVSDKQFIHTMLEMLDSFQNPGKYGQKPSSTSADAAAAADHGAGMLASLAFRLDMCERRLAALEEQSSKDKKPAAKARTGHRKGSKKARP